MKFITTSSRTSYLGLITIVRGTFPAKFNKYRSGGRMTKAYFLFIPIYCNMFIR